MEARRHVLPCKSRPGLRPISGRMPLTRGQPGKSEPAGQTANHPVSSGYLGRSGVIPQHTSPDSRPHSHKAWKPYWGNCQLGLLPFENGHCTLVARAVPQAYLPLRTFYGRTSQSWEEVGTELLEVTYHSPHIRVHLWNRDSCPPKKVS